MTITELHFKNPRNMDFLQRH